MYSVQQRDPGAAADTPEFVELGVDCGSVAWPWVLGYAITLLILGYVVITPCF